MATYTFQQTDTNSSCGAMQSCSTSTVATDNVDYHMAVDGTAGTTETTFDIPAGSSQAVAFFQSEPIDTDTWASGTYTLDIEVTSAQNNTSITHIWLCQVDSTCSTVGTIGDAAFSRDISGAGVFSFDIPGQEVTNTGTDSVYCVVEVTNDHNMTSRTVGVTPSQTLATPIFQPVSVTVSPPTATATGTAPAPTVTTRTVAGTVTLDGSGVGGASVHIINTTPSPSEHVATVTTEADGSFSYETDVDGELHVATQHDDGTTKYNAPSHHSIT